jgi:DNA-binding HxlR family transcriptional regulator
MSRTHCIRRLLEHGELTWGDLMAITGWSFNQLRGAMDRLMEAGVVQKEPIAPHRNIYRLTA